MKMIAHTRHIPVVENTECELLYGVNFYDNFTCIRLNNWGSCWIFEADEYYRSYCAITHNWQPAIITEEEYRLLLECERIYLTEERSAELRQKIFKKEVTA